MLSGACVLIALYLSAPEDAMAREMIAPNVERTMVHTIHDYLALVPAEVLDQEGRAKLLAAGEESWSDEVSPEGNYIATYRFDGGGVAVNATLIVLKYESVRLSFIDGIIQELKAQAREAGVGIELVRLEGASRFDESHFFRTSIPGVESVSSNMIVGSGRNIYSVTIGGAGGFVAAGEADEFLGDRATRILSLRPNLPEDPRESKSEQNRSSLMIVLGILYAILYVVSWWAARLYHKLRGVTRPHPRAVASSIVGVAALIVAGLMVYGARNVRTQGAPVELIAEFTSFLYGVPLLPAAAVLLAGWLMTKDPKRREAVESIGPE